MNLTKTNEINSLTNSRAYKLEIYCFSNGEKIVFPAFLKDFTDSFASNWREENVYGRMDPIVTFKNTTRTINVSFDIPNDSIENALESLIKLNNLIKGLYPVYDGGKYGTAIIASPPMFRVRFANLIRKAEDIEDGDTLKSGLLCYFKNFDFKPDVSSGFFVVGDSIFPKLLTANLSLNISHEHPLGSEKIGDKLQTRNKIDAFPNTNVFNDYEQYQTKMASLEETVRRQKILQELQKQKIQKEAKSTSDATTPINNSEEVEQKTAIGDVLGTD